MSVNAVNTTQSGANSGTRFIKSSTHESRAISKEMSTGVKSRFVNTSDISLGSFNQTKNIIYSSAISGIENVRSMLSVTTSYMSEINNRLENLTSLFTQASSQNFSTSALTTLNRQFQSEISHINEIASKTNIGNFTPLNGSLGAASPLAINMPDGDAFSIIFPNMTNDASPIGAPQKDDLQITFPSNLASFDAAIPDDGAAPPEKINVLASIKEFSGQNSFIYVVANQLNNALTAGNDPANAGNELAAALAALPQTEAEWQNLFSPNDLDANQKAKDALALINNPNFAGFGNALDTILGALIFKLHTQDHVLYDLINTCLNPPARAPAPYINNDYIVQATNALMISSQDYFPVVAQRLKSASSYFSAAQASINQQLLMIEGIKTRYELAEAMHQEGADKYLKTDMIEASSQMQSISASFASQIAATIGFKTKLTQTITDAVRSILSKAH